MTQGKPATAEACANVALVKYWGKRDDELNLPLRGSIAITLDALRTRTSVSFGTMRDTLSIDGRPMGGFALERAGRILNAVRRRSGIRDGAEILSVNGFPGAAGLASSAAGMAALATAAAAAAGLDLGVDEISKLARLGSGSAARSVHGGFVEWRRGVADDGEDSHGFVLAAPDAWDVRALVVIVAGGTKKVSSTDGMRRTAGTSPLHGAFLAAVEGHLRAARVAIAERDLEALGEVAEASCEAMHTAAQAARPPVDYWTPETRALIAEVRRLRSSGFPAWFTIDAGPHVKVLTDPTAVAELGARLEAFPGVAKVIESRVGGPARLASQPVREAGSVDA